MFIQNIFSVTRYTQLIPAYSVSKKPIKMISLQNILMKSWMIGKAFIKIHNMVWLYVTASKVNIIEVIEIPSVL